jgi:redox-regulated HSP33 family molecular chaperone
MFILIAPSETARKNLEEAVQRAGTRQKTLNAFDLHRILISTLHENWRLYIRSLEALMVSQVRFPCVCSFAKISVLTLTSLIELL